MMPTRTPRGHKAKNSTLLGSWRGPNRGQAGLVQGLLRAQTQEGPPGLDGRLSDSLGCWGQAQVPAVWLSHMA